ncbi:MAG: protein kinase [Victivallales bacterium]|nr:protein kinase [Victivallales bacterium]
MSPLEHTSSIHKTQTLRIAVQNRRTPRGGEGASGNWRRYRPLADGPDSTSVPGCTLEGILGNGGMGTVYLARQDTLDRLVAVKVLNNTGADSAKLTARLRREAFIMGAMNHPNLVGCIDIVQSTMGTCIVMEYIPGHINGRNAVRMLGGMPERYVVKTLLGIARGLAYASEKGYTHRDVKPDNLLFFFSHDRPPRDYDELFLLPDSRVALCDFGIANLADEIRKEAEEVNGSGENSTVIGSPLYMAPEQAVKPELVDCRSDIYALGSTAYFLLTGEPPFNGPDWNSIIEKKIDADLPPVRHKDVRISSDFARVLAKMGARLQEERYQDYTSLIRDLEAVELLHADRAQSIRRFIYGHQKAFFFGSMIILTLLVVALLGSHFYTAYLLERELLMPRESIQLNNWIGDMSGWRQEVTDDSVTMVANAESRPLKLKKLLREGDRLHCRVKIAGKGRVIFELRCKNGMTPKAHYTCVRDEQGYSIRMYSHDMDPNSAPSGCIPMPESFPDAKSNAVSLKLTIGNGFYLLGNRGKILGVGHYNQHAPDEGMELNIIPVDCDAVYISEIQLVHGK